jgi:hypothetical protein
VLSVTFRGRPERRDEAGTAEEEEAAEEEGKASGEGATVAVPEVDAVAMVEPEANDCSCGRSSLPFAM